MTTWYTVKRGAETLETIFNMIPTDRLKIFSKNFQNSVDKPADL